MKFGLPKLGLPMFGKELVELAHRPRTYTVRATFAVLLFLMSALLYAPTIQAAQDTRLGLFGKGADLLDVLYEVEWFGLCLFVPALVSGALAAEKERNTLQLLFLTRLGPWAIVIEKLLSRLVPVATFLLVSLPLIFVAYLLGGLTREDVGLAAVGLFATAIEIAAISLYCSAYCATSSSAVVCAYAVTFVVFAFPFLYLFIVYHVLEFFGLADWFDRARQRGGVLEPIIEPLFKLTGFNLDLMLGQSGRARLMRPFNPRFIDSLGSFCVAIFFMVLARLVVVRRAAPQPKHRLRRLFRWLDAEFHRINERYGRGIVFGQAGRDLPDTAPIAWRERRRGNLGRVNYLIRILLIVEVPILVVTVFVVTTRPRAEFGALHGVSLFLWLVAILTVIVRSAGLISAEKARQTFDVLLSTPLTLSQLVGEKLGSLRRVMIVMSVPVLFNALLAAWLHVAIDPRDHSARAQSGAFEISRGVDLSGAVFYLVVTVLWLIVLLPLMAQLAFRIGLRAKNQGRAVTATLAAFVAWSMLPILVAVFAGWGGTAMLNFSPIFGILVNEYPGIAPPSRIDGMEQAFHESISLIICAIVLVLLAVNNRQIARKAFGRTTRVERLDALNRGYVGAAKNSV